MATVIILVSLLAAGTCVVGFVYSLFARKRKSLWVLGLIFSLISFVVGLNWWDAQLTPEERAALAQAAAERRAKEEAKAKAEAEEKARAEAEQVAKDRDEQEAIAKAEQKADAEPRVNAEAKHNAEAKTDQQVNVAAATAAPSSPASETPSDSRPNADVPPPSLRDEVDLIGLGLEALIDRLGEPAETLRPPGSQEIYTFSKAPGIDFYVTSRFSETQQVVEGISVTGENAPVVGPVTIGMAMSEALSVLGDPEAVTTGLNSSGTWRFAYAIGSGEYTLTLSASGQFGPITSASIRKRTNLEKTSAEKIQESGPQWGGFIMREIGPWNRAGMGDGIYVRYENDSDQMCRRGEITVRLWYLKNNSQQVTYQTGELTDLLPRARYRYEMDFAVSAQKYEIVRLICLER